MAMLSISIDDAQFATLAKRAAREGKPVEALLQPVVDELIDESEYLASVDEGLAELDAGKGLDGDEVFRNLHAMLAKLKR